MRGVADQIASIDDEADDTIARSKLSALRAHTDTLRGPRVCKKPEVAVLPVMDYFNSIKRAEDKVAMVLTLLKDIERTAHEEGQQVEVVTVMLRFVDARDRLSTMIQQTMKDYAIACMPLDNYITAILDHPTRLCERWRLEFARWMDFSRMLTRPEGVNSNKGMRYSPIVHKFNETVRFKVSENAYRELFPGAGNDPDSKLTTSLLGPSEFSVRASILLKKGTSKAGMVSDEQLATLLDSATQIYRKSGEAAKFQIQLDCTDLTKEPLWKECFSGQGEARKGSLSEGPDLEDRLQWGQGILSLCRMASDAVPVTDSLVNLRALAQALDEIMAQALCALQQQVQLLKLSKRKQLSSARNELGKGPHALPPDCTWEDALQRAQQGDKRLGTQIFVSSTMASQQAKIQRIQSVVDEGTVYIAALQEWMRCEMSVSGDNTPTAQIYTALKNMSQNAGNIPLFDADKATSRWVEEATKVRVSGRCSQVEASSFSDLPAWFARCYVQCIRVDAEQACVVMVQDLKKLLPATPVAHVYLPKKGWGAEDEHRILESVAHHLHEKGITTVIEITDGAFNTTRNEYGGKPLHVMHKYKMVDQRVAAWTRDTCVSEIQTILLKVVSLHVEKIEIEELAQGPLPDIMETSAPTERRMKDFESQHKGNQDLMRIWHIARRILHTRSALQKGHGVHAVYLHADMDPTEFSKQLFSRIKEARAGDKAHTLNGIGQQTCLKLGTVLVHSMTERRNIHSTQDIAHVLTSACVCGASLGPGTVQAIANLIFLSAPPHADLRNKSAPLDLLRREAAACSLLAFNEELKSKGIVYDAVLPVDRADVKFTTPKWCAKRRYHVLTNQCTTHVFKGLRMVIAHGKHQSNTVAKCMNDCLHEIADLHSDSISHVEVDGTYEQSIPVALRVLHPKTAQLLRTEADRQDTAAQRQIDYKDVAEYIEIAHTYWRACDETGIEPQDRRRMLRDVKRYFLQGIDDWWQVPAYVRGMCRGSWVQLIISIDNMITALDPLFLRSIKVSYIHIRVFNQDAVECLFSLTTKHRTVDAFEGHIAWIVYEMSKLHDPNLGYFKSVSKRKSRIADSRDKQCNPHLNDAEAGRYTVKRASGGKEIKRPVGDPHRRHNIGQCRNACRMRYARPETELPFFLLEIVYKMYEEKNSAGHPIFVPTSIHKYTALKARGAPRAALERAVPQHLEDGSACQDWLDFRAQDPQDPGGPRPINSSDVLVILKNKECTYEDLNTLLRYHQRRGERKQFSDLTKALMKWGTDHEDDGCASALRYLLDGTTGWAEQVGLLRLPGNMNFVACSPDLVLNMQFPDGWKSIPLEIKCPTPMFGNRFDGRMKTKHLLQVHLQMKALNAEFGYLCYWTKEAGYLYKVQFDTELWDLVEKGIHNWREAVTSGAGKAPQSPEDKKLYKDVWTRCEDVYASILNQGGYTTIPSCVARAGK